MHGHEHRGHFAGGRVEQHGARFDRKHFAVQNGVGRCGSCMTRYFVRRNEFADHRFGEALLDAIARRVVLECWDGDGVPSGRKIRGVSRDVVPATRAKDRSSAARQRELPSPHATPRSRSRQHFSEASQQVPPRCAPRLLLPAANCRRHPRAIRRSRHLDRLRCARAEFRFLPPR